MSHTKGKLAADGSLIKSQNGEMVAGTVAIASPEVGQSSHEANTRRLVACWNLLLPFTTEEIEAGIDLDKLVRENAALKTENERLRYLRDNFVRCEPKMDGKHHWIAKGRLIGSGNTFEEAIDTAMKEEKP